MSLLVYFSLVDHADGFALTDRQCATRNETDNGRQQNLVLQAAAYLLLEDLQLLVVVGSLAEFNFKDCAVIAVGGEDVGLPPFIKKQCDAVLRIPMKPEAHSYNASVARSLGLYEYARLRIKQP